MNKMALQNYIANSWSTPHAEIPRGMKLILGGLFREANKDMINTTDRPTTVPKIAWGDHEEADTRIFAHISHCVIKYGYKRVVVQATDILVLSICSTHIPCH